MGAEGTGGADQPSRDAHIRKYKPPDFSLPANWGGLSGRLVSPFGACRKQLDSLRRELVTTNRNKGAADAYELSDSTKTPYGY